MVQLGERNSVEQHSVCSKTYPNLSPIAPLLPGTAGAPSYCGKRDITEIHPATPHIDRISPFQVYRIYQETPLQYFPNTWVSAACSDISRCRNCAQNLPMANSPSFYSSPPKYHLFRPHSDIPSPSAQVPTCFGETPTSGGRSQSNSSNRPVWSPGQPPHVLSD